MDKVIQDAISAMSLKLWQVKGADFYELLQIQQDLIQIRTKLEAGEYRAQANRMDNAVRLSKLQQSVSDRIDEGGK